MTEPTEPTSPPAKQQAQPQEDDFPVMGSPAPSTISSNKSTPNSTPHGKARKPDLCHPQATWNRKLGKVDRPTFHNQHLNDDPKKLSDKQTSEFWSINAEIVKVWGTEQSEDHVAERMAAAWAKRHARLMTVNDVGLGGLMRKSLATKMLQKGGRAIRCSHVETPVQEPNALQPVGRKRPATAMAGHAPETLRKDGVAGLSARAAMKWLRVIGGKIFRDKADRLQALHKYFEDKDDDHELVRQP